MEKFATESSREKFVLIARAHTQTRTAPAECCSVLRDRGEGTRCPAKSDGNNRLVRDERQKAVEKKKRKSMAAVESDGFWSNQPMKETAGGGGTVRGGRGREINENAIKTAGKKTRDVDENDTEAEKIKRQTKNEREIGEETNGRHC